MKNKKIFLFLLILMSSKALAETIFEDTFQNSEYWNFISDDVMGGVSTGNVKYKTTKKETVAILSGNVSTENNGGFIQIQRKLDEVNLVNAKSVKILAKGNNQKYFVHLRTKWTLLPWQYYQSSFTVTEEFQEFALPINAFKKSGLFLKNNINSKNITSIGIVAFGRDHKANIEIKKVIFD